MPLPSVQPLQRLLPFPTFLTSGLNGDDVGNGNGSDGSCKMPLHWLLPLPTSSTLQSNGDGIGNVDGSNGYGDKGGG
jgi:hypothetical protein